MTIPNIESLSGAQLSANYIKCHYPKFYQYLIDNYDNNLKFSEMLYWYYNGLTQHPTCPVCGKPTKIINAKLGYSECCSAKCANSKPSKISKTKQTCQEKYGGDAPACSADIQQKMQATCLERYGVNNIFNTPQHSEYQRSKKLSDETKAKIKSTCLERYGVENAMQNKDIAKSAASKHDYKSSSVKAIETRRNNLISNSGFIVGFTEDGDWICKCPHPDCDKCSNKTYITNAQHYHDRERDHTEPCTNILPIRNCNNRNTSIEIFVQNILESNNVQFETSNRTVLEGKELDIYIPSHNLAIECNGIYSHCSKYKENTYHTKKYKACLGHNIQLLTIWEDWIYNSPEIVESIILSKLGIYKQRIGARQCIVKEVSTKETNIFLNSNHIQGQTTYKVSLGLYYNDELYSIMTFGKKKSGSGNSDMSGWDLSRFCTRLNVQIVGGADKLLKAFIDMYHPDMIFSYSSCDISNGSLYKKLGFQSDLKINQAYWYVNGSNMKRYHRSSFTKSYIKKLGWAPEGDWKEKDVMYQHHYYQIFDSGTIRWIKSLI